MSVYFTDEATEAVRDYLQKRCSLEVMEVGFECRLTGPRADAFSSDSSQTYCPYFSVRNKAA